MKKLFITILISISSLILTGIPIKTTSHALPTLFTEDANLIETLMSEHDEDTSLIETSTSEHNGEDASLIEALMSEHDDASLIEASMSEHDEDASLIEASMSEHDEDASLIEASMSEHDEDASLIEASMSEHDGENASLIEAQSKSTSTLNKQQVTVPQNPAILSDDIFFNGRPQTIQTLKTLLATEPPSDKIIKFYTGENSAYYGHYVINAFCRGYLPESLCDSDAKETLNLYLEKIDELFNTASSIGLIVRSDEPTYKIYRGLNLYGFLNTISGVRPKLKDLMTDHKKSLLTSAYIDPSSYLYDVTELIYKQISSDPALLSTTTDINTAFIFMERSSNELAHKIKVPSLGVLLEINVPNYEKVLQGKLDEHELILRQNTKIQVDSIQIASKNRIHYLYLTAHAIIPPPQEKITPISTSYALIDQLQTKTTQTRPRSNSA